MACTMEMSQQSVDDVAKIQPWKRLLSQAQVNTVIEAPLKALDQKKGEVRLWAERDSKLAQSAFSLLSFIHV